MSDSLLWYVFIVLTLAPCYIFEAYCDVCFIVLTLVSNFNLTVILVCFYCTYSCPMLHVWRSLWCVFYCTYSCLKLHFDSYLWCVLCVYCTYSCPMLHVWQLTVMCLLYLLLSNTVFIVLLLSHATGLAAICDVCLLYLFFAHARCLTVFCDVCLLYLLLSHARCLTVFCGVCLLYFLLSYVT